MTSQVQLVHRDPCGQATFTPKPPGWWRHCGCPSGWPRYNTDLRRDAGCAPCGACGSYAHGVPGPWCPAGGRGGPDA